MGCVQSHGERPDGAKRLTREKVEELLRKSKGQYHDLAEELKEMIRRREETVRELKSIADQLDEEHRKVTAVKKFGAGVGTVAALIAGVGLVLVSPLTGGASAALAVAVGVGGLGTAGGAAASVCAAKLYVKVLDQNYLKKVDKIVERDKEQCERVERLWKEFDGVCTDFIRDIQFSREQVGKGEEDIFDNILQIVTEMKSALSALGSDKSISPLVAVAVLGKFNFEEFIKSLAEGRNGIPSEVAVDIRNKASDLERQCNRWRDLLPQPSE